MNAKERRHARRLPRLGGSHYNGEYCATSYAIFRNGSEIYRAGNHPHDSQAYVDAKEGVGLRTMRRYCLATCKNYMSHGDTFGGIERNDEL